MLLELFSEQALEEANDIKEGLDYLFGGEFDDCENYSCLGFHDEVFADSERYAYYNQSYKARFHGVDYSVFIQYRTGPTKKEKGIYSLGITKSAPRSRFSTS